VIDRRNKMAEKKAKGLAAYLVDFNKVPDMKLVDMFGKKPIAVTCLMKKLWEVIKTKNLKV
jgi:hypothetical protein